MKFFKGFILLAVFVLPLSLLAQSPVGNWTATLITPEDEEMTFTVSIKADNTYSVDFGADGQIEINGTYTLDGNQMTIRDNDGSDCTGTGVYTYAIDGDSLTMTQVSDECEGRGGPEGVMKMKRS